MIEYVPGYFELKIGAYHLEKKVNFLLQVSLALCLDDVVSDFVGQLYGKHDILHGCIDTVY
jgi:hypothetical protein